MKKGPFNFAKWFSIAGFVAGEVYMVFTALAPNLKGVELPWHAAVGRLVALSLFFGPFGALAGLGVGLLLGGLVGLFTRRS